jgi:hypothetical protein
VSEQKGFEAQLGVLAIAAGFFTGPRALPNGCIFNLRAIDDGEGPCARQAGPWQGLAAISCDAIAGFFRDQRGCADPARIAFVHERPIAPVATGPGFIDKDERLGLGGPLADELSNVTLAGANAAEIGDLGAMLLRPIGDRDRVCMDIQAEKECASLRPG